MFEKYLMWRHQHYALKLLKPYYWAIKVTAYAIRHDLCDSIEERDEFIEYIGHFTDMMLSIMYDDRFYEGLIMLPKVCKMIDELVLIDCDLRAQYWNEQ